MLSGWLWMRLWIGFSIAGLILAGATTGCTPRSASQRPQAARALAAGEGRAPVAGDGAGSGPDATGKRFEGQPEAGIPAPPVIGFADSTDAATRTWITKTIEEKRPEAAGDSVVAFLTRAGYMNARVCRSADDRWMVACGPRVTSASCRWMEAEGAGSADQGQALDRRSFEDNGAPLRIASDAAIEIEAMIAARLARCEEEGFPLASIEFSDFRAGNDLEVDAVLRKGPRVRVSSLEFEGARVTRPSFLRRAAGWQGHEAYAGARWQAARDKLWGTGLFESVEGPFLALESSSLGMDADSVDAAVLFRVRERPASSVAGLLAYADRGGPGDRGRLTGYLDLGLGNLLGTGRAARVYWQSWGEDRSTFQLSWHEPYLWRLPFGADATLRHAQEDTLYAETSWSADLLWSPATLWEIGVGWGQTRVVLGEPFSGNLDRADTRFRVSYLGRSRDATDTGWRIRAEALQSDGRGPSLRSARVTAGEWFGRRWRLALEQEAGLISGPDSLLLSDAFVLGGAGSLRGSMEGEYRAFGYAIQRMEFGPRIDARGSRLFLLGDVARLERWEPERSVLYGSRGKKLWRWAAGIGVEVPGRAGRVKLEYAVPGGESIWRGRIHFAVVGSF